MNRLILVFFLLVSCSQWKYLRSKHEPKKVGPSFKMAWAKDFDYNFISGNVPIGYTSAFIDSDILYAGRPNGHFEAFELDNGRKLWSQDEKKALGSQAIRYQDNLIYGSYTGRLFSRHRLTGKLNYVIDLGNPIESTPLVYKDRLFIHLRNHTLMSLDATSGKILWSYKRAVPYTTTFHRSATAIGHENKVLIGFADGYLAAFSVDEGILLWELQVGRASKFVDVDTRPLYFDGKIWAGSSAGPLVIVSPNDGNLLRAIDLKLGSELVVINNEVYAGGLDGFLYILTPEGSIKKKIKHAEKGISSVTGWGEFVAISTYDGYLKLLNSESLETYDEFYLGTEESVVFGKLVVSDNFLSAISSRNRLYVFKL